ncbi:MAG: MBL fold metallo-hydrolase [Terriglobales bacterium]
MNCIRHGVGLIALSAALMTCARGDSAKPLRIYFIDVEGGQSTLVVSPSGKSLLIDTGWPGGRDADRIVRAAKDAGLKQIDYLVITHFHEDHVGGVPDLVSRIKVGTFVDHGAEAEDSDDARKLYDTYQKTIEHSSRVVVKPGEGLPFPDLKLEFVTAAGQTITSPLPGAGEANPYCYSEAPPLADATENSQSVGMLISYGKFRFLDLGDLTKIKQLPFMCPDNLLGTVSLYLTTHHGGYPDNPKALVWALHPQVAIMNNGAHKGGRPEAWQVVEESPGLEDLWQLHYAADSDPKHNVAESFIANLDEKSDGHSIEVKAKPDGKFSVTNSRNGYTKKYPR